MQWFDDGDEEEEEEEEDCSACVGPTNTEIVALKAAVAWNRQMSQMTIICFVTESRARLKRSFSQLLVAPSRSRALLVTVTVCVTKKKKNSAFKQIMSFACFIEPPKHISLTHTQISRHQSPTSKNRHSIRVDTHFNFSEGGGKSARTNLNTHPLQKKKKIHVHVVSSHIHTAKESRFFVFRHGPTCCHYNTGFLGALHFLFLKKKGEAQTCHHSAWVAAVILEEIEAENGDTHLKLTKTNVTITSLAIPLLQGASR